MGTFDAADRARGPAARGPEYFSLNGVRLGRNRRSGTRIATRPRSKPSTTIAIALTRHRHLRYCAGSILRGTGLGAILGVLPGEARCWRRSRPTLEKKVARPPRQFGHGDIRGVAAPEAAFQR